MTRPCACRSIPGFGVLHGDAVERHPRLLWVAAAGLTVATLLGTFGMLPVGLHLPTHDLGIMGPLCGMTRSVARAAVGDIQGAWRYNPGGVVLVAGAWSCVARSGAGRVTGRWLNLQLDVTPGGWWAIATALTVLTVNQQLHAEQLV